MIDFGDDGDFIVDCDAAGCGQSQAFNVETWDDGIDQMKGEGWLIKKVGEEWQHFCPEHADIIKARQ